MSVRLGIAGSLLDGTHEINETIEQVCGIVRAGGGFRVILHGERRDIDALQAFDHVIVQIDMADEHLAVFAVLEWRVEDEGGFGFVDTDNNPVIPSQFLWAGDFHEGRAEVQTRTGMGLIDREGGYVIPPEYEIVDYDPAVSIVHVRHGGRWALFDYLGRRLTEFGREDMQEPVRQEPCRSEICR